MGSSVERWDLIDIVASKSAFGDTIRKAKQRQAVCSLSRVPLVASGSDNSPENLLISNLGYRFIDVFPMRVRPTVSHALGIIAAWDGLHHLVPKFTGGAFDEHLRSAAGVIDVPQSPVDRMAWLVLALVMSYDASDSSPSGHLDWLLQAHGLPNYQEFQQLA